MIDFFSQMVRPALLACGVCAALTATPAAAQQIGAAAIARNEVRGSAPAREIVVGADVYRAETVRTGGDSQAKLVFLDDTNISLGPSSSIVLDRFVYSGDNSARAVSVNFAKGAFRFATGNSDKKAYELRTPIATIGVRGTVLDIRSETGRTTVVLVEGAATVCARKPPPGKQRCRELTSPGDVAVVTASGASGAPAAPWSFAETCRNSIGELCGFTRFAQAQTTVAAGDVLCGR